MPETELLLQFLGGAEDQIDAPTPAQELVFGKRRKRLPVWLDLDRHQVAVGGTADRAPYVAFAAKVADGIARGAFD